MKARAGAGYLAPLLRDEWRGRLYLFSPVIDFLMIGGGALLALAFTIIYLPRAAVTTEDQWKLAALSWLAAETSLAVNNPHFILSYQLFYRGFRNRLGTLATSREMWWRTLNAGLVVPLLLLGLTGYALMRGLEGDNSGTALCFGVMVFFVGWHYCKQAFGVFITLSALKKLFYTAGQRRALVANAYAVWWCSLAYSPVTGGFFGVSYASQEQTGYASALAYLEWARPVLLALASATTLAAAAAIIQQWRATGHRPSATAVTGYLSMYYLWGALSVMHPAWIVMAPFFHGIQYMLFVAAYKRGEMHSTLRAMPKDETKKGLRARRRVRNKAQEFFGWAFLLGLIFFNLIPSGTTAFVNASHPAFLPETLLVLLAAIFINIHHFFIDNVVWRKENPNIGAYLTGWRSA